MIVFLINIKLIILGERHMAIRPSFRPLIDNFIGRNEDISKIRESLQRKKLVFVRAPYGFGTSEVVVAVGHLFNATSVVHADMCDMGLVSLSHFSN